MKLSRYRQTRPYTCGPSCLVAAVCELGGPGPDRGREMAAWKKVRHFLGLGSTPAGIAEHARSLGLGSLVVVLPRRFARIRRSRSRLFRQVHRHLKREYAASLARARSRGQRVRKVSDEGVVLDLLLEDETLEGIFLILDPEDILHFVLVRGRDKALHVMDPAFGVNDSYTRKTFLERFADDFAGYVVLLFPGS